MSNFFNRLTDPFSSKSQFRKNLILKMIINLVVYVSFLLTFLIFRIFNIRFISSPTEALGHQVIDLECFMHEFKNTNYKIVILDNSKFLANRFFFKYQKKKFQNFLIIKNFFLCTILYYVKRKFRDYLSIDTQHYLSNNIIKSDKILNILFKKKKINYSLDTNDKNKALEILKKIGINKKINKKIACIHVRDKSFKAYDDENYRSSNFFYFKKSIDYLISKNYTVFRLGIVSDDKKKLEINNYFDLTKFNLSREENEILTVYLMSISKLFIGSCSGVLDLATIFNVPSLATNHAPLSHTLSHGNKKLCLPKFYKSIKNDQILNFKTIVNNNYDDLRRDKHYKDFGIKLIDNSSDEIYLSLKELLANIKKKNFAPTKNQLKFRSILKKNAHSIFSNNQISDIFLKKNKKLLDNEYNKII